MSRTRTKPTIIKTAQGYHAVQQNDPLIVFPTQYSTFNAFTKTETMTDEVTPNFYSRSKAGEVIVNAMSKTIVTTVNVPTFGKRTDSPGGFSISTLMELAADAGYLSAPAGRDTKIKSMITAASTNAMAKVTSEEIQILATMGEIRETKELLVNACKTLVKLRPVLQKYRDLLKRIKASKGKRALLGKLYLDLENLWMEIRMGWRPFFYEVKCLNDALTSAKTSVRRQTFRGKAKWSFTNSVTGVSWYKLGRSVIGDKTYNEDYTVRAGTLAERRFNGFPDTFGLTKIPQTIWELTKLSWAVDYFFNVGEFIAAYTPDTLWTPIASWYTQTSVLERCNTVRKVSFSGDLPLLEEGYSSQINKTVIRKPGTSLGITFRPRMNWKKYIDIVAVARQHLTPLIRTCLGLSTKKRK